MILQFFKMPHISHIQYYIRVHLHSIMCIIHTSHIDIPPHSHLFTSNNFTKIYYKYKIYIFEQITKSTLRIYILLLTLPYTYIFHHFFCPFCHFFQKVYLETYQNFYELDMSDDFCFFPSSYPHEKYTSRQRKKFSFQLSTFQYFLQSQKNIFSITTLFFSFPSSTREHSDPLFRSDIPWHYQ